jgi:hypothetical protein
MFNNTVAGYDRIWQVAQSVWKGITSAMVSRAFVLAYRIMHKIIEEGGNNAILGCAMERHTALYDGTSLIPMMAFNQVTHMYLQWPLNLTTRRDSPWLSNSHVIPDPAFI